MTGQGRWDHGEAGTEVNHLASPCPSCHKTHGMLVKRLRHTREWNGGTVNYTGKCRYTGMRVWVWVREREMVVTEK